MTSVAEDFTARMRQCVEVGQGDSEAAHSRADYLLQDALRHLGGVEWREFLSLYDDVPKWYA